MGIKRLKNWLYRRRLARKWGLKTSALTNLPIEPSKFTPEHFKSYPVIKPHKWYSNKKTPRTKNKNAS